MRDPRRTLGVFPSPLWGGVRGGGRAILSQVAPPSSHRATPLPNPPPQGGREHTEFGEGADRVWGSEQTEHAAKNYQRVSPLIALRMSSSTPSIFDSTSLFQWRSTR